MPDLGYDFAAQNLLCAETNDLCFDHLVSTDGQTVEPECENLVLKSDGSDELSIGFVPVQSEEILCMMFERERELLPRGDFLPRLRSGDLDVRVRREALDWIYKAYAHYRFGALAVCLAINYLDRFLSVYELPSGKNWTVQLLAVSCLSLAAKLEEVNVPLTVDLQVGDPKFVFEAKTIKRMELLVLSTLNWRMQACTPCSFIDYFLRNGSSGEDIPPSESLICRSIQIILDTNKGIDFLEFRPSEISAAVAIYVTRQTRELDIDRAMSNIGHVEKVRVLKCVGIIQELTFTETSDNVVGSGTTRVVPQSPVGVLDVACLSYKSDERTVESCPSSSQSSPHNKRRKLD